MAFILGTAGGSPPEQTLYLREASATSLRHEAFLRVASVTPGRATNLARRTAYARTTPGPLIHRTSSASGWPVVLRPGALPYAVRLSGLDDLPVFDLSYSAEGLTQTLTVTLAGDRRSAKPSPNPTVVLSNGVTTESLTLPVADPAYEWRYSSRSNTTTITVTGRTAQRLAGTDLPELVPFKQAPTGYVRLMNGAKPQRQAAGDLLLAAYANVGVSLSFTRDLLGGLSWVESLYDYHTGPVYGRAYESPLDDTGTPVETEEARTPQGVFDDTIGGFGFTQVLDPGGGIRALYPGTGYAATPFGTEDVTEWESAAEAVQTPRSLTVKGGDLLRPREGSEPEGEWYTVSESGGSVTYRGYRKSGGLMRAQIEITAGDVTVRETVNGKDVQRTFVGVAKGIVTTTYEYDSRRYGMLLAQKTVRESFGYHVGTVLGTAHTYGPALYYSLPAGHAQTPEESYVTQIFDRRGYLRSRMTRSTRVVAFSQTDAENTDPAKRGALQTQDLVREEKTETYVPMGDGSWTLITSEPAETRLPVYDFDSGEAIRVSAKGGARFAPTQHDRQTPERWQEGSFADRFDRTPQQLTVTNPGALGGKVSATAPYAPDQNSLASFLAALQDVQAPRVRNDVTTYRLVGAYPGVEVGEFGVAQSLSVTIGAGKCETRFTALRKE